MLQHVADMRCIRNTDVPIISVLENFCFIPASARLSRWALLQSFAKARWRWDTECTQKKWSHTNSSITIIYDTIESVVLREKCQIIADTLTPYCRYPLALIDMCLVGLNQVCFMFIFRVTGGYSTYRIQSPILLSAAPVPGRRWPGAALVLRIYRSTSAVAYPATDRR